MLACQTGKLLHAVQILKGVGKSPATLPVHHLFHGDFFPGLVADVAGLVGGNIVLCQILGHQCVNFRLGDGLHLPHQITDSPGVHLPAQPGLNLHLVALGNGHLPHVVTETHDLHASGHGGADGGPHPEADALLNCFILPVPGDNLPWHSQAGAKKTVFPVAVGSLIQIHEVHVDLLVGDLLVILRCEVAIGFLKVDETIDPHLAGREGVAPGDDSGAGIVIVGLSDHAGNLLVGLGSHFVDEGIGQDFTEFLRHLRRPRGYGFQHIGAIQRLAAHNKPKFSLLRHMLYSSPSFRAFSAARSTASPALYRSRNTLKPAISSASGFQVMRRTPAKTFSAR